MGSPNQLFLAMIWLMLGYFVIQLAFSVVLYRKIQFPGSAIILYYTISVPGALIATALIFKLRSHGYFLANIFLFLCLYYAVAAQLLGFCAMVQQPWPRQVLALGVVLAAGYGLLMLFNDAFWIRMAYISLAQGCLFSCILFYVARQMLRADGRQVSNGLFLLSCFLLLTGVLIRFVAAISQQEEFMAIRNGTMQAAAQYYLIPFAGVLVTGLGVILACMERVTEVTLRAENHDELTGLANRRALVRAGRRELERALAEGHALTVALVDIDFFKRVNDTHGHETGDHVLREVAQILGEERRQTDLAGRFGGEEFCLLFPGEERAALIGQRLVEQVRRHVFNDMPAVTISVGLATLPEGADEGRWEQLVHDADQALYAAKANGRNRYECHQPDAGGAAGHAALAGA